ncbi:MAG: hypothetical protein WCK02_07215 [Bacteroidota bacterium]
MKKIFQVVLVLIIGFVAVFINLPVINYGFYGVPVLLLFLIIVWLLLNFRMPIDFNNPKPVFVKTGISKGYFIAIFIILFYIIVLPAVTSWPIFHSDKYRDLIGKVESGDELSKHIPPISIEKIRVVDESLAKLLGDKVLGAQPALGSQIVLGTFNIQKVKDELFWVAPLLHSGFFKWQKNSEGTNGYVMVSATNERDVRLVQKVNGEDIRIKYQSEAYFLSNLERYLYFKGYCTVGLTDYSFEINDEGRPYWVVTKYEKSIGFNGDNATGVVVVDVKTGEIKEYAIKDAPLWIDRIQPNQFVESQLNDWGQYVKGFWNFSNENKLQITEGVTLVYGENNKSYWYTGLTSVGADEATVGFVLVDTRTKQAVWYKQSGATEFAAQNSAIGKVQEKGYSSSLPIPYNINNIPTYVMTLKDKGGLVKMFAMVAIEDYTIVGVGNTLRETLMSFKNAYNMAGNKLNVKNQTQKVSLSSVITRINSDSKNGNSYYYFTLKDKNNIFIGSSQISSELPITNIGDSVIITFDNDVQEVIDISSFNNVNVGVR